MQFPPPTEESQRLGALKQDGVTSVEKELRESRAQLDTALKAGRMGSWELDLAAGLLTSSDTCKANFGRSSADEFTYQDLADSIHPDDRQRWSDAVAAAIAKGSEFAIEYRTIWPDETVHWIVVRGNCFPGPDGTTTRLAGVTVDITERKIDEQKLEENSRFNQDVIDSLAAHIAVLDKDGTITAVNEAWRRFAAENGAGPTMKGVGPGVSYLNVCRASKGSDGAEARAIYHGINDVLEGRRSLYTIEYPCHCPTQQRWFLLSVSPLGGCRGGVVVSHTNITERRLAEDILRQYQDRLELVKDGAEIGFWFCDLPFDELEWDHRVKDHFWLPAEAKVTIETFYERLHPDDRERTRASIEESITNRTPYDIEYRTMSPEGEVKLIRAIGRTFYDDWGKPIRFDGVTLDITTRRRAEKALRDRELLESAVKLQEAERTRIARDLHDQLGQQLTGLRLTLTDLMASADDAKIREKIERAQENARALDRDVSSLAFELRANMPSELGLADALENFVGEWSRNYGIAADFHALNPESRQRLPDEVETHLYRIVQEALNNTTKHSTATRAGVILEVRGSSLRLIVEDDGVGFDLAARSKAAKKRGRGLGLVGMRERVSLLGGTIEIDSSPGGGTTVFVTVPLAEEYAPVVRSAKTIGGTDGVQAV